MVSRLRTRVSRFHTMVSRLHATLTEGHALLKWWRYWYRTVGTIWSTHRITFSGKHTIALAHTISPSRANTSSSCCRKNSSKPRYQSKWGDHRLQPPSSGPRHWVSFQTLLQAWHRPYVSKVCHRCPQEHCHRSVGRGARSHFGQVMRRVGMWGKGTSGDVAKVANGGLDSMSRAGNRDARTAGERRHPGAVLQRQGQRASQHCFW